MSYSTKKISLIYLFLLIFSTKGSIAQDNGFPSKGNLSGSFENYSQYYLKDTSIKASLPPGKFGLNSFLKLDYNYGKFSAGVQFESYLPPVLGYFPDNISFSGSKLINKYFKYSIDRLTIQVGDFYEQFGSGLIFRAYENRQIGINNAVQGARIEVEPFKFLKFKAMYGNARKIFDYSDAIVKGVDAHVSVNELMCLNNSKIQLDLGGSFVNKFEEYSGGLGDDIPKNIDAFAGRFDISGGAFSLDAEYVSKSADPSYLAGYSKKGEDAKGKGFLLNAGINVGNFGSMLSYRSIKNMIFMNERVTENPNIAPLNFIPALTKQHDNLTSNIYVYGAQFLGETGFQADLYYNFKPGSNLGGKYGLKVAANVSYYAGLNKKRDLFIMNTDDKFFSDINLEIKKKWNKKLETTVFFQNLFINDTISAAIKDDVHATIVSLGALYKWAPKKSIRIKLEHLFATEDFKSWVSGLTEFSFSSPYQFFISDLYNYGDTKVHYYNFGASYTKSGTRFALSYGRQREGLFCAGGICRILPAANGFTASLTSSFGN
jgi:hypothetical protein